VENFLPLPGFESWTKPVSVVTIPTELSRLILSFFFFLYVSTALYGPGPPRFVEVSRSHIRHTTLGRTPLDEWSARRRDLYLTTHNTHKRQTSMP
jgi:hypothetical protein